MFSYSDSYNTGLKIRGLTRNGVPSAEATVTKDLCVRLTISKSVPDIYRMVPESVYRVIILSNWRLAVNNGRCTIYAYLYIVAYLLRPHYNGG
jgi:hypothetical protein